MEAPSPSLVAEGAEFSRYEHESLDLEGMAMVRLLRRHRISHLVSVSDRFRCSKRRFIDPLGASTGFDRLLGAESGGGACHPAARPQRLTM